MFIAEEQKNKRKNRMWLTLYFLKNTRLDW